MSSFSKYNLIIFLFTHLILLSAVSCTDRGGLVSSDLVSADSLMMTAPEAALDILSSIDSIQIEKMGRRERAFYTLLRTEAEYKCYHPVAGDTAIYEVVEYYRSRGPEDRLERALVMQGAVLSERDDIKGAMTAYKEAELKIEEKGSLEEQGLINVRIGELYQRNSSDKSDAIARYKRALEYFERANLSERVMQTHFSIASLLITDTAELAISHIQKGLSIASRSNHRLGILTANVLYIAHCSLNDNDTAVINIARKLFEDYGYEPQNYAEHQLYGSVLVLCSESYASLNKIDSAEFILGKVIASDIADSVGIYNVKAEIAKMEGQWKDAWRYENLADRISDSITVAGYEIQLSKLEKDNENRQLKEELQRKTINSYIIVTILLSAVILLLIISIVLKHMFTAQKKAANIMESTNNELTRHIENLSAAQRQEEKNREQLTQMLKSQLSVNNELRNFYCRANEVMDCVLDNFYRYESDAELFSHKTVQIINTYIAEETTLQRATAVLDAAYPGFLDQLLSQFPKLTDEDMTIIALTSCGFSTGALCAILKISENYLNVKKTRVSKKMNVEGGLTKYLKSRISHYSSEQNLQQ